MTVHESFYETSLQGTRWPVPKRWRETGPGAFSGPEGILNLSTFDGELLDPARCGAAAHLRDGDWALVETSNGVSIHGRYLDEGATVSVFSTRSDVPAGERWPLPEVQATYVFRAGASHLADQVAEALQVRRLPVEDFGALGEEGHAAMGPVPVLASWFPPDAQEVVGSNADRAVLSLIGGGFMTLADRPRCCALVLEPLPWRRFSIDTAVSAIGASLRDADVRFTEDCARVWNWELSGRGCSYEAFRVATRTRVVGAAWADQFGQSWHLRYRLGPEHGKAVEQELLAARDELHRGS